VWHNFGHDRPFERSREILLEAFTLGVTHLDAANNYGPPPGAAEENLGKLLATDLRPHRDELIISTKAGYEMWAGPYGDGGSRKYLLASLDQSLRRLGVDYVDIFYSHRPDPDTPIEETMGALRTAVAQGKALYVGISSYDPDQTRAAASSLGAAGVPLTIHQPAYSMFDRTVERTGLLDVLDEIGAGCIGFMPLAQGLLSDRYLDGVPEGSRASRESTLPREVVTEDVLRPVRRLAEIARDRGQTLAQMALAWTLRDPRMTSTLVGVSSVDQLRDNVAALDKGAFDESELAAIKDAFRRPA
jgi:L-glyceraldehyde 3-phosphate reductase